jgi:hypothetical protein
MPRLLETCQDLLGRSHGSASSININSNKKRKIKSFSFETKTIKLKQFNKQMMKVSLLISVLLISLLIWFILARSSRESSATVNPPSQKRSDTSLILYFKKPMTLAACKVLIKAPYTVDLDNGNIDVKVSKIDPTITIWRFSSVLSEQSLERIIASLKNNIDVNGWETNQMVNHQS